MPRSIGIVFILLILLSSIANAQLAPKPSPAIPAIAESDTGKLYFEIANLNYFKDNEYFSPIASGYTLIGYFLTPRLLYIKNRRLTLDAGVHLQKYSGINKYSDIYPVFSLRYAITDRLDMIFGTLHGTYQHRLPEPIFSPERYFTHNIENGLQFAWQGSQTQMDVWLDWERFIFEQDTSQEQLTFGISTDFALPDRENGWQLHVPFRLLIEHRGGQINNSDKKIETLVNLAGGLSMRYYFGKKWIRSIELQALLLRFRNTSHSPQTYFKSGWAVYPQAHIHLKYFTLMAGYWEGNRFYAPKGEPLFWSISKRNLQNSQQHRRLANFKITYHKRLFNGLTIGSAFENYYDLINQRNDYAFGIYVNLMDRFLIKKIK